MIKYLVIGVIALAILASVLFYLFGPWRAPKEEPKATELTIWGLWEDESAIAPALEEYKKTHPGLNIVYKKQNSQNYRTRVETQIVNGKGPDIFMIHNTWLPMVRKAELVAEMPSSMMSLGEFGAMYNPVVRDDFTNYSVIKKLVQNDANVKELEKQKATEDRYQKEGRIFGLPRGIDGLVLYYNEELLANVGITNPPETWVEFSEQAAAVNSVDQEGEIQVSGAAMGLAGNIDHWSDIIGLLFVQLQGASLENPANDKGVTALTFYRNFLQEIPDERKKTWDETMERSLDAFVRGRLVFYIGPSWRAHEMRQINPEFKFKTAPVPQVDVRAKAGWATYWGYTVSSKTKFPKDAWELVKFLTSEQTQKQLYDVAGKSNDRLFGIPYSAVNLQKEIAGDPVVVGAVVSQAPYFKSWYLASDTNDQGGMNEQIIKYYEDAVNSVAKGSDPMGALQTTAKGVTQVLDQYDRTKPAASVKQ